VPNLGFGLKKPRDSRQGSHQLNRWSLILMIHLIFYLYMTRYPLWKCVKRNCVGINAVCIVVFAVQCDSEEYKLYSACLRKPSSQLRVIRSHLKFPAFIRYIQSLKT
jgi:hypothetical protein